MRPARRAKRPSQPKPESEPLVTLEELRASPEAAEFRANHARALNKHSEFWSAVSADLLTAQHKVFLP